MEPGLLAVLTDLGAVGVCIAVLVWLLKNQADKYDQSSQRYVEDIRGMREEHRDERTEWLTKIDNHLDQTNDTLIGLTRAIDKQNNRARRSDGE